MLMRCFVSCVGFLTHSLCRSICRTLVRNIWHERGASMTAFSLDGCPMRFRSRHTQQNRGHWRNLVRLGQIPIQKTTASPIILTGYQNRRVYFTNDQLGGPGIMYPNGVSHMVEPDHLRAVKSAIDWLSYVPSVRGGLLPITDIRGVDEIGRPIGFMPSSGTPFDRRGCCSLVVLTTMVAGSAGSLTKESSRRASLDGQRLSLLAEPVLEASPWVLLLPKKDDRSSEACRSCGREGFGGCRSRSRMRVVSQQSLQDCPGHQ